MTLEPSNGAVSTDARGHDGRDGRETLTGVRVRVCGHGSGHTLSVRGTSERNGAGFDRRSGRDWQRRTAGPDDDGVVIGV